MRRISTTELLLQLSEHHQTATATLVQVTTPRPPNNAPAIGNVARSQGGLEVNSPTLSGVAPPKMPSFITSYKIYLVGGFKHFLFSIMHGIILPIDSYFSEGLKPPTTL